MANSSLTARIDMPGNPPFSGIRPRSVAVLALLMIVGVAAYSDLQVFALMISPLKLRFGLTDSRVGVLQDLAFNLGSALMLYPAGRLVDRHRRTRFLLSICLAWTPAPCSRAWSPASPDCSPTACAWARPRSSCPR